MILGELMRIVLLAKSTIHFLICLILIFIIRHNYYALRSNNNFDFVPDGSISEKSFKSIENFFKDNKSLLLNDLAKNCVEKFSPVKNITFRKYLYKIRIFLELGSPILNINNKFVITDNNKIVEISFFTENYLKQLPIIISKYELNSELANFLTKLTYKIFEKYSVEIEEQNIVWLKFKENQKINILARLDFVPSKKLIKISNKLLQEKLNYLKKNNKFVADLRFKDQIIVFQI